MMLEWIVLGVVILVLLVVAWMAWRGSRGDSNAPLHELRRLLTEHLPRLEREVREEVARSASGTRQELGQTLSGFQRNLLAQQGEVARSQNEQIDSFRTQLSATQQALVDNLGQASGRQAEALGRFSQLQEQAMERVSRSLADQLQRLSEGNERRLLEMRNTMELKLSAMQADNERKLEQMRATVDEKLHQTLEQRLGESFKQVAERLEQVHKGLGEMHGLARDVGSLSRVLNNVKTRGILGEVQLAGLLEQVFTPEQYAANVETVPGTGARVEFALRLPGQRADGAVLWLPIDAKFPREDYERLLDAQDRADVVAAEAAAKAVEARLRFEAKAIRTKYIAPPHTTDFAILFVPTEGLYAEALRRPGLVEALQRDWRVMLAGPTTLLATLNSLQMGFRTLALEKRSVEVWEVLGAVKTEFQKFGDVLAKTRKKLTEASNQIEMAERRSRVMARELKSVEALPEPAARQRLSFDEALDDETGEPSLDDR